MDKAKQDRINTLREEMERIQELEVALYSRVQKFASKRYAKQEEIGQILRILRQDAETLIGKFFVREHKEPNYWSIELVHVTNFDEERTRLRGEEYFISSETMRYSTNGLYEYDSFISHKEITKEEFLELAKKHFKPYDTLKEKID